MITAMYRKFTRIIWKDTLLYIFHMGTVHTNGHIVLAFTSNRTGMTTNAQAVVDDKTIIHIFWYIVTHENNKSNVMVLILIT